ncbi:hypothetical protein QVD17_09624 [Tagetes erecta]|uniref:Uncharacterized protein n=1 Tax=Tagetes erecta TaxID=13708 RepID=A0AAD8L506_TARER|nr:hypothetical protein QVD17_09624 [Tagetes erecta]
MWNISKKLRRLCSIHKPNHVHYSSSINQKLENRFTSLIQKALLLLLDNNFNSNSIHTFTKLIAIHEPQLMLLLLLTLTQSR